MKRITEDEIKSFLLRNEYFFIKTVSENGIKLVEFSDTEGYLYLKDFQHIKGTLKNKNGRVSIFYKGNPFVIYNIKKYLENNNLPYFLQENQHISSMNDKLIYYDNEGYYYFVIFDCIRNIVMGRAKKLDKFYNKSPYAFHNLQVWIKNNNRPFELIEDQEYKGWDEKLLVKCFNCPEDEIPFKATQNDIIMFGGCAICENRQVGKYNSLEHVYPEIADEWDHDKNNGITPKDIVYGSHEYYNWICPECGHKYNASVGTRTAKQGNGSGCPLCVSSKLEKKINSVLKKSGLKYKRQHKIKECRNILPLPFDFVVWKKDKLFLLIEAQGLQHYRREKRGWFSSDEVVNKIKYHDGIKLKYCKDNNIPLLVIPYWDFDNIENILTEKLKL